jgi:hypothetical protein
MNRAGTVWFGQSTTGTSMAKTRSRSDSGNSTKHGSFPENRFSAWRCSGGWRAVDGYVALQHEAR